MITLAWGGLRAAALAFLLAIPGAALAQATTTTTSDVRNFEVLSVNGNMLLVRDQHGTHEYTVPPDFRFDVDGRPTPVSELKAGMKGTATVTTKTTVKPVYVTEIKNGTVLSQTGRSVVVKEDSGKIHRFTQSEVDARGIQLYVDGEPVRVFNLEPGEKLTAKIVSSGAPETLTAKQVDAVIAADQAAAAAAPAPEAAPEATAAADTSSPAAEAEAPAATTEVAAAPAEPAAEEGSKLWLWILLLVLLALIIYFVSRGKDDKKKAA